MIFVYILGEVLVENYALYFTSDMIGIMLLFGLTGDPNRV